MKFQTQSNWLACCDELKTNLVYTMTKVSVTKIFFIYENSADAFSQSALSTGILHLKS